MRELPDVRDDAAGLASALARERYRCAAGLPPHDALRDILRAHKLAPSAEGLAQAREALGNAEAEDPRRPGRIARLSLLRDFLARARALELEPGAAQELFELDRRPLVKPPGDAGLHGAIPAVTVERELPVLRSREKRGEMEEALATAVRAADGGRSAMWDAARAAQSEAGLRDPEGVAQWPEEILQGTEEIFDDLGAWLLERHTGVKAGAAARHDVLHLLQAPRSASAFPTGEVQRTVRRWAEMLRLVPSEMKIDDEDRPLKLPGARAEPVDPPWEAALTFLPAAGPRALGALLGAIGTALLRLGPPPDRKSVV